MVSVVLVEPPLLLAQTVYSVVGQSSVDTPYIVPLLLPKEMPLGRLPLMSQEVIIPAPESVGDSGRSLLTVLLISSSTSGEYTSRGIWSTTVIFR